MKADRPLVIVHTEASCGWGGQDIRVLREAEWFRAHGHTVHLVTPPEAELFKRAAAAGFSPVPMALKKNTELGDFFRLRALFKRLKPDVVGTHSSVDSWVGLLAAKSVGVKCRLRYRHVSTPVKPNFANRWQYKTLASHVITTGDSICRHLMETLGLPRDHTTSVPTGVEAPANLPSREEARINLARQLNLPRSTRFIGQVSVLRSWKGHADLISGFAEFAATHPDYHLVIVGGGDADQRANIRNRSEKSGIPHRIHAIGHVENPWFYHLAFDVETLLSTKGEGIPQSLMQAMLVGTPVIGTMVGGIPEVVRNGETGILVPPGAPDLVANSICETIRNQGDTEARAKSARRLIEDNHAPEHTYGKVMRVTSPMLSKE